MGSISRGTRLRYDPFCPTPPVIGGKERAEPSDHLRVHTAVFTVADHNAVNQRAECVHKLAVPFRVKAPKYQCKVGHGAAIGGQRGRMQSDDLRRRGGVLPGHMGGKGAQERGHGRVKVGGHPAGLSARA